VAVENSEALESRVEEVLDNPLKPNAGLPAVALWYVAVTSDKLFSTDSKSCSPMNGCDLGRTDCRVGHAYDPVKSSPGFGARRSP